MAVAPVVKIGTDLFMTCSKTSARLRVGYVLYVEVDPAFAGAPIVVTYKRPGESTWRTWMTLTTDALGKCRIGTRGYRVGTYTYRARFAGNSTHTGSSATHTIRIVR